MTQEAEVPIGLEPSPIITPVVATTMEPKAKQPSSDVIKVRKVSVCASSVRSSSLPHGSVTDAVTKRKDNKAELRKRNAVAATKSRLKRKAYIAELVKTKTLLLEKNKLLLRENQALRKKITEHIPDAKAILEAIGTVPQTAVIVAKQADVEKQSSPKRPRKS